MTTFPSIEVGPVDLAAESRDIAEHTTALGALAAISGPELTCTDPEQTQTDQTLNPSKPKVQDDEW
jgi:hypothetical protein